MNGNNELKCSLIGSWVADSDSFQGMKHKKGQKMATQLLLDVDKSDVADWVREAQAGDKTALDKLCTQFWYFVYAICLSRLGNRADAEEVTQDVFVQVVRKIAGVREPERFRFWLISIAKRLSINYILRCRHRHIDEWDHVVSGSLSTEPEAVEAIAEKERSLRLYAAVRKLNEMDKEVIELFHLQGLSLLQVSDRLEVPVGTLKTRLHFARQRLRELLARCDKFNWVVD